MKILLLTQLFQPEPNHLKGLQFAKHLMACGHHVEVLTGFPNYPEGKIYDGYKIRPLLKEVLDGIPVTRVAMYPSHDGSALRRIMTYLSFALTSAMAGIFLFRKFDIVHVCQGAATLVFPGLCIAWMGRAKLLLDVQDIWPESVSSSGMLRNQFFLSIVRKWADFTYRIADAIVVLSNGYKQAIVSRGGAAEKIHVVYNWSNEWDGTAAAVPLAGQYNFAAVFDQLKEAGKFIVLYAGSMGHVQALEAVLCSADLVQRSDPALHFIFIGGGVEHHRLKTIARTRCLLNVSIFQRVDAGSIGPILAAADALLIHLRIDPLSAMGIPQKTQAYLAAGKPIVMAVDGEAAELVRSAHAGIVCTPEDPSSIAEAVRHLQAMTPADRQVMGDNGRRYYHEEMSFSIGVKKVMKIYAGLYSGVDTHH
jgi:colanic acid biosynthesis glycosyl transferase WcaI